jgi:protein-disulfide isomerase
MSFNYSEITHADSIKIGSDDAPLKIVEYINLRCPDSKNYEENVAPFLNAYIKNGTVQRILKHFDKQKYPLEVGNVLNQYLDYSTPEETFNLIKKLFEEQETWGKNRLSQIPHIAKEYGLSLQAENREQANRIDDEIKAVNVTNVPTVFVGEEAFVETIGLEEFKETVEDHFK